VHDRAVWASGTGGTGLDTNDGGETWRASTVAEGPTFAVAAGTVAGEIPEHAMPDERVVYLGTWHPIWSESL